MNFPSFTEAGWMTIIGAIVALATVISALATTFMNWRLKRLEILTKQTHDNTNSMKDALVASVKKASYAEGKEDQRNKEEDK